MKRVKTSVWQRNKRKITNGNKKVPEKYCKALEKMNKKIENLVKQVSNEEAKMPFMPSQAIIKPSTFDGNTCWQVFKMQFMMVSEAKAFHFTASLRGDEANILKKLSRAQRQNCDSLSSALEL